MNISILNDNSLFSLTYDFFDDSYETEIGMIVNGDNILSFEREGRQLTTRWNLDEIVLWLREFLDHMKEDPYPIEIDGEYSAIKDINAHEFDTEDDEEFDAYYDKLDEWCSRHRWHPASSGAILANLYFQLVGDNIEISWDNQEPEDGVTFKYELGGVRISKELFVEEVNSFLRAYEEYWSKVKK